MARTLGITTTGGVRGFPYRSNTCVVSNRPCCIANSVAVERVEAPVLA
jgi:hypothetical protein